MKKGIIILLFLSTLLQALSKVVIYIDYKINQDYIAQNLCENKAKPQLHCNGKCQLSKQLKKDDDNSKEGKKSIQEAVYYCNKASFILPEWSSFALAPTYNIHPQTAVKEYHNTIFHPPNFII
ncbi:hypothetical protein DBR32_00770 [Taibaiella sp. KBW10]|uniref:hypothetical protein n=1 Tax=Taibaiella sp. KBW10 TaxID=2153357 RepID=UPI000F5A8EDA|nr:hypothetical protein [Taibaiella sp. KBW10]RQO32180.1 hypothetical protein DBR32_00770 [Taibaiella sp. KBW10]